MKSSKMYKEAEKAVSRKTTDLTIDGRDVIFPNDRLRDELYMLTIPMTRIGLIFTTMELSTLIKRDMREENG